MPVVSRYSSPHLERVSKLVTLFFCNFSTMIISINLESEILLTVTVYCWTDCIHLVKNTFYHFDRVVYLDIKKF